MLDDDLANAITVKKTNTTSDAFDVQRFDDIQQFESPTRLSPDGIVRQLVRAVLFRERPVEFLEGRREREYSIEFIAEKVRVRMVRGDLQQRKVELELCRRLETNDNDDDVNRSFLILSRSPDQRQFEHWYCTRTRLHASATCRSRQEESPMYCTVLDGSTTSSIRSSQR